MSIYIAVWGLLAAIASSDRHKRLVPIIRCSWVSGRGITLWFVILIRPDLSDAELRETAAHERKHIWQYWVLPPGLFLLLYAIPYFQRRLEAQCYAVSSRHGRPLAVCAETLAFAHFRGRNTPANVAAARRMIERFL